MKLSSKIFAGFGIVLSIAMILTGTALYIMKGVAGQARILSNQYMPETQIASSVERSASKAVSAMNEFDAAYDESFLSASREHLNNVKQNLQEAGRLTTKFPELKILKKNAANASARLLEYETLITDTENTGKEIQAIRSKLESAAQEFMKSCLEFVDNQAEEICYRYPFPNLKRQEYGKILLRINVRNMKKAGRVIWLRVSPETIRARMSADTKTIIQWPGLTATGNQRL